MHTWLQVSLADQRLSIYQDDRLIEDWPVSTALAGAGEHEGSGCTPRGWHRIHAMIGADHSANAVFVGRSATGEYYSPELAAQHPERDWILTRILWLEGIEVGRNRGGEIDTLKRYIYIHGTPDSEPMGIPASKGCIRMHNQAVMAVFAHSHVGMRVYITESS